jgi:fumarate reductase subunit D
MIIITGSSPKQQDLGHRNETCHACRQETSHRLQRHYAVKHLFWFPLFSMGTTYSTVCERCNLLAQTSVPPAGSVRPAPLLHRMGFLFPIGGVMLLVLLALPFSLAASRMAASGETQSGMEASVHELFSVAPADKELQKDLQGQFDELGLSGLSVTATSADAAGKTIRVIAARFSRLKKVSDGDRLRLLEMMEEAADESFPDDEVFLGLHARILWGGYSHRAAGQAWSRKVDSSTDSPERNAEAALRTLMASASKTAAAADAASVAGAAADHELPPREAPDRRHKKKR